MASWTNQSTSSLLPGEPWTSAKALAAFENPEAIAEGASGAPKIRTAALQPPTAGSAPIRRLKDFGVSLTSTSSPAGAFIDEGSIGVLVSGTIRVVSTIVVGGSPSYTVSYRKNGTAFATYSASGLRFSDVSVTLGDRIDIIINASYGGGGTVSVTCTEIKIESGTSDFAVG